MHRPKWSAIEKTTSIWTAWRVPCTKDTTKKLTLDPRNETWTNHFSSMKGSKAHTCPKNVCFSHHNSSTWGKELLAARWTGHQFCQRTQHLGWSSNDGQDSWLRMVEESQTSDWEHNPRKTWTILKDLERLNIKYERSISHLMVSSWDLYPIASTGMGWEIPASFSENPSILPETVQDERIWEVSWCFRHQSAAWETSTSVTWEINKWHGGHGNQDSHGFYHFHLQISSPLSCQHPTQAHARVLGNALWGLLGTRCHGRHGRHGRNGCHDDSNDHVDDQEDIHLSSPSQCHEKKPEIPISQQNVSGKFLFFLGIFNDFQQRSQAS